MLYTFAVELIIFGLCRSFTRELRYAKAFLNFEFDKGDGGRCNNVQGFTANDLTENLHYHKIEISMKNPFFQFLKYD